MKQKTVKEIIREQKFEPKSWYRWVEVSDYSGQPRQHGEYSNKEDRIMGKAIRVKMTPTISSDKTDSLYKQ